MKVNATKRKDLAEQILKALEFGSLTYSSLSHMTKIPDIGRPSVGLVSSVCFKYLAGKVSYHTEITGSQDWQQTTWVSLKTKDNG